ncbi:MAG: type VI secretion system baseplate subunit TssE [Rhodospirillales bacterium]|nr:type VI secretion system baseplate subunit TssE [Rhodospirillales bacterium]
MAESIGRERLQPSLLDRLTDHAPESQRESFDQQSLSMPQLRQAVLRDLAWLLNTTNLASTGDLSPFPLTMKSTLNYGAPGLTGLIATGERLNQLESELTTAIHAFEPRIRPDSLSVRLRRGPADEATPTIRFEIAGELWAHPVPEQLFVETAIELETRLAVVTDRRVRR